MKKILLMTMMLLSGCSILNVATFDGNQYGLVNSIRTESSQNICTKEAIESLYQESLTFKNYSQYLPHNDLNYKMASDLFTLVDELHQKVTINETYCKLKLNTIEKSAERIQKTLGGETK
jgi:hypothetical protein